MTPLDADGDEDVDLVVSTFAANNWVTQPVSAYWLENDGAQSFTRHEVMEMPPGLPASETLDADGDGDDDVLLGAMFGEATPRIFLLRNQTIP